MKLKNFSMLIAFAMPLAMMSCNTPPANEHNKTGTIDSRMKEEKPDSSAMAQPKAEVKPATGLISDDQVKQTVNVNLVAEGDVMAQGDPNVIRYDNTEIKVPANSKVKLHFSNKSTQASMMHDFVLIRDDSLESVAMAGIQHPENDYVNPDSKEVLFHTKMLKPGEDGNYEFNTPPPGTYYFLCTYPGHYTFMNGKFIVQ